MKWIATLLMTAVLVLGTACDQTSQSPPPVKKVEKTQPKAKQPLTKSAHQLEIYKANLLTLSSAVGALQSCKNNGLYESPIYMETFYQIAQLMREPAKDQENPLYNTAVIGWRLYMASIDSGIFAQFTVSDDGTWTNTQTNVSTADACKAVDKVLENARGRNGILDGVKPARPIGGDERDARLKSGIART
jgi:hypothetical protein